MKEPEIKNLLKAGWIRAIVTFEVAGKPKEHVEDALTKYLDNIKKDSRIKIIEQAQEDAFEHEDGIFSTFAECEMLVEGLETFTWLCINFSPASIEIMEPDEIKIEARDITNWLNDLLAKIHDVGNDYRTQLGVRDHLTLAMNQLIQNAIFLSLKTGKKKKEALAKDTGILEDQLTPFLDHLVKKEEIALDDEEYSLS